MGAGPLGKPRPICATRRYANLLGPHDREQAKDAYGANGARLRALKRRFDPDGVFTSAIPLPDQHLVSQERLELAK